MGEAIKDLLKRAVTIMLGERAAAFAERHMMSCNLCTDQQYVEIFRAVALHVKQLRSSTKGMESDEASDFIAAHLHAASMRTMVGFQESFNELVIFCGQMEAVMTFDQKAEFERIKAFAGKLN